MTHSGVAGANPLAGITVVDLSRALAGALATALLADLGATVIKIEDSHGGDSSRAWPPFDGEHSLYFDSVNRSKSSVALDFRTPEALELLHDIAMRADVLIENYRPGVLDTMGLGALREENPALVIGSVTGFGKTGPLSATAGLDQVAQAMSGIMSVTGTGPGQPLRVGLPIIDMYTGAFLAVGINAALVQRERTGEGSTISTSLIEAALAVSTFQSQQVLSTGVVPVPHGNSHPVLAPYGVFATSDLPIVIAIGNGKQWRELCRALGEPGLADESDFATDEGRRANREALETRIESLLARQSAAEWLSAFRDLGIPTGPIYDYGQVFDDPQIRHLDMVTQVRRLDGSALPLLRGPLSVNDIPTPVRSAPPALGEHTWPALRALGVPEERIRILVESRIVAQVQASESA